MKHRIANIFARMKALCNTKPRLASYLLGAAVALALPPFYIIPFLCIGLSYHLYMLIQSESGRVAFWRGWWFGFGYFTFGLYWISFSLLVDIAAFGWMIPFAIFGIAGILALYNALVAWLVWKCPVNVIGKLMCFAGIWCLAEILRGYAFTGFPWNLIGYSWGFSDIILQTTSIVGIWGLSLFTVLIATTPIIFFFKPSGNEKKYVLAAAGGLFALMLIGGGLRLIYAENVYTGEMLRIVQGNITQNYKRDEEKREEIFEKYLALSTENRPAEVKYLIWPESAIPFIFTQDIDSVSSIGRIVPDGGLLISGTMRATVNQLGFLNEVWNSLHVLDSDGKIVDVYDKHHLVPFGEYVPFRSILPLDKITPGSIDFSAGTGAKTLDVGRFPSFSPLICYEVIFPDNVLDKGNPPQLLINVTNDAWYGYSSGPFQHYVISKVRAIEYGIPLIRAANTGISAMVDGWGRELARSKLNESTVLDVPIPIALPQKTTYSKIGLIIVIAISVFCIALPLKYLKQLKH